MEGPRWFPVPRQKLIEPARRMALNHSFEHISEIGEGLDVVELGRGEERSDNGPAIAAAVRAGEQMVLAAERNHPFILPMSGWKLKFITGGTRSMGAASGDTTANSAPPGRLFTLRHARRGHGNRRMDAGSCRLRRYGNDRRAACDSIGAARASSSAQRARFQRKLPGRSHYRPGGTI